jgi:hypothetical protein
MWAKQSGRARKREKQLDNLCTYMLTFTMLPCQISLPRTPRQANSFPPMLLQTLSRPAKSQLLWNQANPHSSLQTTRVGYARKGPASPVGCQLFNVQPHKYFNYRFLAPSGVKRYADSRLNSFIYRIYAERPGVGGPFRLKSSTFTSTHRVA